MRQEDFLLEKWIELANDSFITSKALMFEKLSSKKPMNIPAYLLHLSIELYLKAFLMNNNVGFEHGQKGHNLNSLFSKCIALDPNLNDICMQTPQVPYKQSYWIAFINNYGEDGGLRYLSSKRPKWEFFVMIHDYLDDLINYITINVDKKKVINRYI